MQNACNAVSIVLKITPTKSHQKNLVKAPIDYFAP